MKVIKLDDFPVEPVQDQIYEIIPDKTKIVASTNRLFNKYPTRYISAVPRFAILKYSNPGDIIMDPFCGSGTTAIEAMLQGRNAVSVDIDPFARLLIKVKTTKYSNDDLACIADVVKRIKEGKPLEKEKYKMPNIPNLEKWFCDKSAQGLAYIKDMIDKNTTGNQNAHDFLYVVMAGIIRKVSNADEVSPKPYISSKYPKTPADPFELFVKTEELYRVAIQEFTESVQGFDCNSVILKSNDARNVGESVAVDLAVTSPPYINAYDYVRSLRFEDVWLGLATEDQLRDSRKKYVGTEITKSFYKEYCYATQSEILRPIVGRIAEVDEKRANVVNTYFEDMSINMVSVREKLKAGGRYVIVVGDSKIRNQEIPTAKILTEIAEKNGYDFELSFKYVIRDRYLHLPRGERGGIIKYDEILVLKKR